MGGNILTKDVEKTWVFNSCFAPVFNNQMSCSEGIQPPELEDRDNGQDEAPITLDEMVSGLLHHSDRHKPMGLGGIHLSVLREPRKVLIEQPAAIYFLHRQIDATIT